MALTHASRHTPLEADVWATASQPRKAGPTRGAGPSAPPSVEASPPGRVASGLRPPSAPARPPGRRFRPTACGPTGAGRAWAAPCWPEGPARPLPRPPGGGTAGRLPRHAAVPDEPPPPRERGARPEGLRERHLCRDGAGETPGGAGRLSPPPGPVSLARDGGPGLSVQGDHARPTPDPPWGGPHPPGERGHSCERVHPQPDRTRHGRGATRPSGERHETPLAGRSS